MTPRRNAIILFLLSFYFLSKLAITGTTQKFKNVKIENSHDATTIVNQVDALAGIVGSMPDEVKKNKMPIKEEKTLVIDAAKQFLETINRIRNHNLWPQMHNNCINYNLF